MNDIARCPHCQTRMVLTSDGRCPACGLVASAAKPVPAPPPPRPPWHPILHLVCIAIMAWGFWRHVHHPVQSLELVVVDLGFVWTGAIGLVLLQIKRGLDKRRPPA